MEPWGTAGRTGGAWPGKGQMEPCLRARRRSQEPSRGAYWEGFHLTIRQLQPQPPENVWPWTSWKANPQGFFMIKVLWPGQSNPGLESACTPVGCGVRRQDVGGKRALGGKGISLRSQRSKVVPSSLSSPWDTRKGSDSKWTRGTGFWSPLMWVEGGEAEQ